MFKLEPNMIQPTPLVWCVSVPTSKIGGYIQLAVLQQGLGIKPLSV